MFSLLLVTMSAPRNPPPKKVNSPKMSPALSCPIFCFRSFFTSACPFRYTPKKHACSLFRARYSPSPSLSKSILSASSEISEDLNPRQYGDMSWHSLSSSSLSSSTISWMAWCPKSSSAEASRRWVSSAPIQGGKACFMTGFVDDMAAAQSDGRPSRPKDTTDRGPAVPSVGP